MVYQLAHNEDWEEDDYDLPEALLRWHTRKDEDLGYDIRLYNWQKWGTTE